MVNNYIIFISILFEKADSISELKEVTLNIFVPDSKLLIVTVLVGNKIF